MKKIIALIMAGIMACSIVACGDPTFTDAEDLESTIESTTELETIADETIIEDTVESETIVEDTTTAIQDSDTIIEETTAEEPITEAPAVVEETIIQTFPLNVKTKIIHYNKCPYAAAITFNNLNVFWGTEEEAQSIEGYTWCKSCAKN